LNRYILPRRKDNHLEGTRQIDSVTLEKGGPLFKYLNKKATQNWGWRLFIKNTGLCKMLA
jgi:hypothetical protein